MVAIKKVNTTEIIDLFSKSKKVNFENLIYVVNESGSRQKKGRKSLQKQVQVIVTTYSNYKRKVEKVIGKTFEPQPLKGKLHIGNSCILTDEKTQSKFYIQAIVEHHTTPKTTYFHNNLEITKNKAIELDLFSPSYFTPKKTVGRGTVSDEKNFHFINPQLERILKFKLNGQWYENSDFIDIRK